MQKESVFDQFTNQYSLSKTLRFELRPVGNTQEMLKANNIIALDEQRQKNYEKTKPFFDKLHQEFIVDSLKDKQLASLDGYIDLYSAWKMNRKDKAAQKMLELKEKEIRQEIVALFDECAAKWIGALPDVKLKKKDHGFLFEKEVFSALQQKYGNDPSTVIDGQSIFASWDKWTAYFKKFFETRKNFYKSDGTATAVATRIVNDNLRRFCENIILFRAIQKSGIDLSKIESDFGASLVDVFDISSYNQCLWQKGINAYNLIIGGETLKNGEKVKGINEYLNEHKQKTGEKLPRLKALDKQIGSDREHFIDLIENNTELHTTLTQFIIDTQEKVKILNEGIDYLTHEEQINFSGIYFRKEAINTITRRWFANYEKISMALMTVLKKAGNKNVKFDEKSEEYKFPDFINWQAIREAIEQLANENTELWKQYYVSTLDLGNLQPWQQFLTIFQFEYDRLLSGSNEINAKGFAELLDELKALLQDVEIAKNEKEMQIIKAFADRVLNVYRFAKYFSLEKSKQWNPDGLETDDFYVDYEKFYGDSYEKIVKVYDKLRNYITKKAFNQNKWVLNFENPTLADGWDKNKEVDNTSVLLRKDGRYYLGIMDKNNKTLFRKIEAVDHDNVYEKLVYKQVADASKDIHNLVIMDDGAVQRFTKMENKQKYWPAEIFRIKQKKSYAKENFNRQDFEIFVDYMKIAARGYWADFQFIFSPTSQYNNIKDFTDEIATAGYKISFQKISEEYIDKINQEGKLYLFEIHNKDWNFKDGQKKTGIKNAHTLYFEHAFSSENIANNSPIKLNGEAELFFRPATDENKLGKREDNSGKMVVKSKRYAKDKIFFHIPITLNRTAPDARYFNQSINSVLTNNPDVNIIGIDRGEKHLAYLSVINQKGEILEIKSLNKIKDIDYASLLDERAKNREAARRDWKSIEQIKDLKKGYISNVVREIADLIIKYNAIVVFEDLNMRFKQVRGGIEKSVYQQLEKALIDKLNFLINKKEIDPRKAGHVLRAYQLTAPFESFKDMHKQTGVLFYTQAEYTSQTDPITGFRKNLYVSNSATIEAIQKMIHKFDAIGWDDKLQSYYIDYNPINFVDEKFKDNTLPKDWRVHAKVPRIKREKHNGYWEAVTVNPNEALKELFQKWDFDNLQGDMKDQIFQMKEEGRLEGTKEFDGKARNFWQSFIYIFNLILQLRNSTATQYKKDEDGNVIETIEGVDFIASPVAPFFCTDGGKYTAGFVNMASMKERVIGDDDLKQQMEQEFNGDANGAYNIARKGIVVLERIGQNSERPELFISKKDWDEFATRFTE